MSDLSVSLDALEPAGRHPIAGTDAHSSSTLLFSFAGFQVLRRARKSDVDRIREGSATRPWIGYMFLLEDCPRSTAPVGVKEPHFKVFPEFENASYGKRYELFCRRLVLERHYDSSAFMMSEATAGLERRLPEAQNECRCSTPSPTTISPRR